MADQIITESWCDAWENYRGSTEDVKRSSDPGYYTALFTRSKKGSSLSPSEKKKYNKRMKTLLDACNEVIRRHPNTPYAIAARWLPKGSRRWGVKAYLNRERHKIGPRWPKQ
jgi:phage terminase small subunit